MEEEIEKVKGLREVGMNEVADRAVLSFLSSTGDISDCLRIVLQLTEKMSKKMSGDMWEVLLDEEGGDKRCEQS